MCCIVHIEGEKKEKGYRLLIVGRDRLVVGWGGVSSYIPPPRPPPRLLVSDTSL